MGFKPGIQTGPDIIKNAAAEALLQLPSYSGVFSHTHRARKKDAAFHWGNERLYHVAEITVLECV